jgi:outer membrane protein TolC
MNLAWCMIALTLLGVDDPKFGTPPPSGVAAVAPEVKESEVKEPWRMDLATAIHIAFDNSENFRVVEFGVCGLNDYFPLHTDGPITIARLNADVPLMKFKADAIVLVRSVEQAYWNLAQAQAAVESIEQAVRVTTELLNKAQPATTSRSAPTDAIEAAERLEQFDGELCTRKSERSVAERELHKILALPSADGRRIVAASKPNDASVSFDWDTCVEDLLREQPDNVQQQAINRLAELNLLLARNQLLPLLDAHTLRQLRTAGPSLDSSQAVLLDRFLKMLATVPSPVENADVIDLGGNFYENSCTWYRGLTFQPSVSSRSMRNTRQAQYALLRVRAREQQVLHQSTRSLARTFLDVDASYKQYTAAKRLQAAAAHRLEVQRAYYDEGRITIDRFLDAVEHNADAIAVEARYQAAYNVSLAALCEAKGTLLIDRNVTMVEGPKDRDAYPVAGQGGGAGRATIDDGVLDPLHLRSTALLTVLPASISPSRPLRIKRLVSRGVYEQAMLRQYPPGWISEVVAEAGISPDTLTLGSH